MPRLAHCQPYTHLQTHIHTINQMSPALPLSDVVIQGARMLEVGSGGNPPPAHRRRTVGATADDPPQHRSPKTTPRRAFLTADTRGPPGSPDHRAGSPLQPRTLRHSQGHAPEAAAIQAAQRWKGSRPGPRASVPTRSRNSSSRLLQVGQAAGRTGGCRRRAAAWAWVASMWKASRAPGPLTSS